MRKGGRIAEPIQHPVRVGMHSEFQGLSGKECAAAKVRRRTAGAAKSDGLAALECSTPYDVPSSDRLVCKARGARHEALTLAEGQLVTAAEMENVANIEIRQAIVKGHSETGNVRRAETNIPNAPSVEQVAGVGHGLGPRVGKQEVQPTGELLFDLSLQRMVSAHTRGRRVAGIKSEIRKRYESFFSRAPGRDRSGVVGARKSLQMPRQRSHVAGLYGHGRRQLVLEGEISPHRVWSDVVKLNSAQA